MADEELSAELRSRLAKALSETRLTVAVLGPGAGSNPDNPDYQKRRRVHHSLRDQRPTDSFVLPEEVASPELIAEFGLGLTEAKLMELCDLVIALIPPDARASGVLQEIVDFIRLDGFAEKLWIFRPNDRLSAKQSYQEQRVYEVVLPSRFIDYSPAWWTECSDIRKMATEMVDSERKRHLAINFG